MAHPSSGFLTGGRHPSVPFGGVIMKMREVWGCHIQAPGVRGGLLGEVAPEGGPEDEEELGIQQRKQLLQSPRRGKATVRNWEKLLWGGR